MTFCFYRADYSCGTDCSCGSACSCGTTRQNFKLVSLLADLLWRFSSIPLNSPRDMR